MKIDIDLSEIFDDGEENVKDSVRDVIVSTVTQKIYSKIDKEISAKISTILEAGITAKVREHLDKIIPELMDYEFTETSSYGATKTPTTVKNQILKHVANEVVWKESRYESDRNSYTRALYAVVETKMAEFKKQFNKDVDALFVKEAMEHAQLKLRERLGIK